VRYTAHRPAPPLADAVDYLWCLSDAPEHARERIVPSGTIEIVFNLHEDAFRIHGASRQERRFGGAIVSGCYGTAFEIDTRAHALVVGVHFKPGGAARLLGAPPNTIADDHVALDALWGAHANALRARLCAVSTPRERVHLLEQALLARMPERAPSGRAVTFALAQLERPGAEVGRVAQELGTSRRRFIEMFTRDVGMTPKRWAMVRRFQRALAAGRRGPSLHWARIALECGYYDQAHMCRDFAALTGLTPSQLLAPRATEVKDNHVALPTDR
jgi:AraC-like DNA-binding protein